MYHPAAVSFYHFLAITAWYIHASLDQANDPSPIRILQDTDDIREVSHSILSKALCSKLCWLISYGLTDTAAWYILPT